MATHVPVPMDAVGAKANELIPAILAFLEVRHVESGQECPDKNGHRVTQRQQGEFWRGQFCVVGMGVTCKLSQEGWSVY